jgi:hypothetical protein
VLCRTTLTNHFWCSKATECVFADILLLKKINTKSGVVFRFQFVILPFLLQQSCFVIGVNARCNRTPAGASLSVSLAPPTSPPLTKNPTPFCHILVLPHCHRPRWRSLHKMPRFSLPFTLRRHENSAPTFIPHYVTWFLVGGFLSHRSVGSWQSAKFSWSPWCCS